MNSKKTHLGGAIVLYFIIGLEILTMISPFAGYFYAVFNPFLLGIAKYPATRWLSAFFLPHMVVPPTGTLKFIRIMGSVLFVLGMATFFVCAAQVYASKLRKQGTVLRGLYSYVRHPQYLALSVAGIGLSVLWPRFLVIALWLVMVLIYYFLARDEERRMLAAHEAEYTRYIAKTGMLMPKPLESMLTPKSASGKTAVFIAIAVVTISGAFILRQHTVASLPLWGDGNVAVLPISAGDTVMLEHRMSSILEMDEIKTRLQDGGHYLAYFMSPDYIMQGMIADTGGQWQLYKRHHTISMITDWIIHPFRHLEEGHHMDHAAHDSGGTPPPTQSNPFTRRLIFLRITGGDISSPHDMFSINAVRTPALMVDVDVHNLAILDVKELQSGTGWGQLPTPVF